MTDDERKLKQAKLNVLTAITHEATMKRRKAKKLKNPLSDQAMRIGSEIQGMMQSIAIIEKEMV